MKFSLNIFVIRVVSGYSGLCLKPIPDPNKIRVRRVDSNIIHTRLAQTHTRIIISGSDSSSRVGLVLPGLSRINGRAKNFEDGGIKICTAEKFDKRTLIV